MTWTLAAIRIGKQLKFDGLEIHHERIGQDIVGAIWPPIEGAGILLRQRECRVVDDDIAANRLSGPPRASPAQKLHHRSRVMYGSPPPCRIRSPSWVQARVCQRKAGPSMSSAAKVVTVLIVDAGLRGVSALWLATTRSESASRITKLAALAGRRCAAIHLRDGGRHGCLRPGAQLGTKKAGEGDAAVMRKHGPAHH